MKNYKEELESLRQELNSRIDAVIAKVEKPAFEVGKWYKGGQFLIYPTDLTNPNNTKGYGFDCGNWTEFKFFGMNGISKMNPATNQEAKEALTKEAIKKYPIGTKIKTLDGNIIYLRGHSFIYFEHNTIYASNCNLKLSNILFQNGIWAEPIKTMTIDDLASKLIGLDLEDTKSEIVRMKTEIIETLNNL